MPFPDSEQEVWWEVWLDITNLSAEAIREEINDRLQASGCQISSRFLVFPEHLVILVKGSAKKLAEPLLYSQYLDELRKPVELSDAFTSMNIPEQKAWIANLAQRLEVQENPNLSVCLLDSGINENHPLLTHLKSIIQVDSVDPSWGTNDSWNFSGHGTPMSGIIFFGETSSATAFASKFAASVLDNYPTIWPETVRALMVHAAQWTDQMLGNKKIEDLSTLEKIQLLRTVGYGVPFLPSALYTLQNSVSLVIQETIKPYTIEKNTVKANECHVFTLPWPQDQLLDMGSTQVRLNVTLSYFVEPNPGSKRYARANNYASFGFRFKLKDTNETSASFLARINKEARAALEEGYQQEGKENWVIGQKIRDKGSVHRDIWIGNAADLATKNELAIIPTGGWWKTRPIHQRYNQSVRYSLIISIEADSEDILTPILNELKVDVDILNISL